MASYVLSCSSTVDVPRALLERRNIRYVYFNFQLDGADLKDDFGASMPPAELYAKMLDGAEAHTSQVSAGEYVEFFTSILESGNDVVHVCLSSGISGTYNSAITARELLAPKYPDRHIYVVDSLAASAGYGLLVDKMADLRDEGMSAEDLVAWAEEHKLELNHWFFSSDLTFFIRGGRISKAAGLVGGMLKICPVMTVEHDGSLAVVEKVRTKKRTAQRVVEIMKERAQGGLDYSDKVFISQSECLDDAHMVGDVIEEQFAHINGKVQYSDIGSTIGVHTGPGTVALFYWGEAR